MERVKSLDESGYRSTIFLDGSRRHRQASPSIAHCDQGDQRMNASEWVFRYAGGCLIEHPDLTIPGQYGWRYSWAVTLWPDPSMAFGWGTLRWSDGERGWDIPVTTAVGDIIEFGAVSYDHAGNELPGQMVRWFGWLSYATERALVVYGPYPTPAAAMDDARPVIDEIRLAQLTLHPLPFEPGVAWATDET